MVKIDCTEAIAKMADYLDRELSAEELAIVEAHIDGCECCANAFRFEGSILRFIKENSGEMDLPEGFEAKLFANLPEA